MARLGDPPHSGGIPIFGAVKLLHYMLRFTPRLSSKNTTAPWWAINLNVIGVLLGTPALLIPSVMKKEYSRLQVTLYSIPSRL